MSKDEALRYLQPLTMMNRSEMENEVFNTEMCKDLKDDKDLRWCFTALGLGGLKQPEDENSELFLFGNAEHGGSQNFLFKGVDPEKIVDRKADAEKFAQLHFNFQLEIKGQHFTCDKIFGEDTAIITDWKGREVACVRFIQDTRSPWILIPDDPRPFEIAVVNRCRPDSLGYCREFHWWHEEDVEVLDKSGKKVNRFHLKPRDFGAFVDRINGEYFDLQSTLYVQPKKLSRLEKGHFVGSQSITGGGINGCPKIEIVKSSMQTSGEIYIDGIIVGSVSVLNSSTMKDYPIKVTAEKDVLTEMGISYKQILMAVNQTLTVEPPSFKGGSGKKQFRNSAFSDSFKK